MSENGEFPRSPCYICGERIEKLKEGFIAFGNFVPQLNALNEMRNLDFVMVVTAQYFRQFPDVFSQKYS